MTKDKFIWLGIRMIGLYWFLKLIGGIARLIIAAIFVIWSLPQEVSPVNYFFYMLMYVISIPVPLILSLYFLFFGKLAHRFISHFVSGQKDEVLQLKGSLETVVRFVGLCFIGSIVKSLFSPFSTGLRSALQVLLIKNKEVQSNPFLIIFGNYLGQEAVFLLCYVILMIIFVWYFLKRGQFVIDLLGRGIDIRSTQKVTISQN